MVLWDNIRKFTIYRKMLLSYTVLVLVSVILISAILFRMFSHSSIMEINNISQSALSQTSYAADVTYDQVFSIGNELLHNNEIITAMHSKQKDVLLEYNVVQKLAYIQAVYPFISFISIYNGNIDRYLNNKAIISDEEVVTRIKQNDGSKFYDFIPRTLINEQTYIPYNVLTFIIYSNFSQNLPKNGALIINVNANDINRTIMDISQGSKNTILVINTQGTVLSHTTPDLFLSDFSNEEYIRKILDSDMSKGHMLEMIDGKKHLVTYVKSDPSRLDWIFISMQPYHQVLSGIYRMLYITLLVAFILISLGILGSLFITRSLYNPLSALIKKFNTHYGNTSTEKIRLNEYELLSEAFAKTVDRANSMEISLKSTFPFLRETYMKFLINGSMEKLPQADKILKELDSQLTEKYYCVLVFMIDNYRKFEQENVYRDRSLLRFAICNVAQELMEGCFKCNAVDMEKDHVAVLARLESSSLPDNIMLTIEEIQNYIKQYFKFSISAGIGCITESRSEISASYKTAVECVKYRLFYGHSSILDYSCISGRLNNAFEYPCKIERTIIEGIQLGSRKDIIRGIEKFSTVIGEMTCSHVFIYSHQLILSIQKEFAGSLPANEPENNNYYEILHSFEEIETLDEITEGIMQLCLKIAGTLEERKSNKNNDILKYVCEYVQENYNDPNLSLEAVAELVHLSSGYLGKLFKSNIGKSFNDYVNTVRLDRAKELLIHTGYSTAVIGEKIGIYNNTYFFTLFKKTFGMTPTQYRNQPDRSM